jgi:hypothetical protein
VADHALDIDGLEQIAKANWWRRAAACCATAQASEREDARRPHVGSRRARRARSARRLTKSLGPPLEAAQERWRRFNRHELVSDVFTGATLKEGIRGTDDDQRGGDARPLSGRDPQHRQL